MNTKIKENNFIVKKGFYSDKEGGWWPGYALSFNRDFYKNVGGIYDKNISGKNDVITTCCLTGNIESLKKQYLNNDFFKDIEKYKDKVLTYKEFKGFGYADNLIKHNYHGSYAQRKYNQIEKITIVNDYNPKEDLVVLETGLYDLKVTTTQQQNIRNYLIKYINERTLKE